MLAATDGIWETKGETGELYGMVRLESFIRSHATRTAAEISEALRTELAAFRGQAVQDDDVTFVLVKITGGEAG